MAHDQADRDDCAHALREVPARHRLLRRPDHVLDASGGDAPAHEGRARRPGSGLRGREPDRGPPPGDGGNRRGAEAPLRMIGALTWAGVALLGAGGAWARFVVGSAIAARRPSAFPFGTFAVNLSGGFLLGLLTGLSVTGDALLLLGSGMLGAYT